MWYRYTIDSYSSINKMKFVRRYMLIGNAILSEMTQSQRNKNHMF